MVRAMGIMSLMAWALQIRDSYLAEIAPDSVIKRIKKIITYWHGENAVMK